MGFEFSQPRELNGVLAWVSCFGYSIDLGIPIAISISSKSGLSKFNSETRVDGYENPISWTHLFRIV